MIKTLSLNSTSGNHEQSAVLKAAKYFKYELIKVLIFLLLFGASVFFVNSVSHEYYNQKEKTGLLEK